ncbi:resolvase [Mesorhizobium sp. L-8-10]|uniref:recombinase family protein n=1 Tax=Mesorhizobium sp. L-8-10 TaxID=2744523 RepID=UPI001925B595|nr:recombinase family protein [Mesorhizobium sp. L-8-10]BCH33011.1 resolvase [Mesorhizobium sp. L-8-10]
MRRAAIYIRVSTDEQTTANQERQLLEIARHSGWDVVQIYRDQGVSGAKGRDKRPAFDALCSDITRRRFDIVMVWSVDRLGRSLQDLVTFLSELHALRIDLFLHQQGIDTTTPAGKAMFQVMAVFAEFERAMIRDRVKAGLARARAEGKKLGRPKLSPGTEAVIRAALVRGESLRKAAKSCNASIGTVHRIKASLLLNTGTIPSAGIHMNPEAQLSDVGITGDEG